MGSRLMALFVCVLLAAQPIIAQEGVITLDLGEATDEELFEALGTSTEIELIMRGRAETETQPLPQPEPEAVTEAEQLTVPPEAVETSPVTDQGYIAEPEPVGGQDAEQLAYTEEVAPDVEAEQVAEEAAPAEETMQVAEEGSVEALEESQRLVALAEEAYERGDYEAATAYAEEASRLAAGGQASTTEQPTETESIAEATDALEPERIPLPATFTVRPWAIYRDSLWTIAGRPEIFGNPFKWPVLFDANRRIMPNPNNPDLIHPGMVLDIPSIEGELREGAWQSDLVYER